MAHAIPGARWASSEAGSWAGASPRWPRKPASRSVLYDSAAGAADGAKAAIAAQLRRLVEKGRIGAPTRSRRARACTPWVACDDLSGCRLVIEAIVEDLVAKRELFRALERVVGPECLIATNTSSLSVTAIAAACARPERVGGLHFFSPVPLMKVVEVVEGVRRSLGSRAARGACAIAWGTCRCGPRTAPASS